MSMLYDNLEDVPTEILDRLREIAECSTMDLATLAEAGVLPCPLPRITALDRYQKAELQRLGRVRHRDMAYVPYLKVETSYADEVLPPVEWTPELVEEVGTGKTTCLVCEDSRLFWQPARGVTTGLRVDHQADCECRVFRRFFCKWHDLSNVPLSYRSVHFDDLDKFKPGFWTFTKSGQYEALKAFFDKNPNASALLSGRAGTGKTTLLMALYRRALQEWSCRGDVGTDSVWCVNALTLMKELRTWEMRDQSDSATGPRTKYPTITENRPFYAAKKGLIPRLFIDELDKIKLDSSFQVREITAIMNAVYANGGQIVATTNMSPQELAEALGPQHGPALVRRMTGPHWDPDSANPANPNACGALVDFTQGSLHVNWLDGEQKAVTCSDRGYIMSLARIRLTR